MNEPVWLEKDLILDLHEFVITDSGGSHGMRDERLLESALARPLNRFLYENIGDLCELAATYAHAISSNHAFVDGNKRAAFMALGQFLEDTGWLLVAERETASATMLALAAGELDIAQLTDWVRAHAVQANPPAPAAV
jgi:death-on-curing protein